MPPVGFEPTISAHEQPQTHALDRVVTGTGKQHYYWHICVLLETKIKEKSTAWFKGFLQNTGLDIMSSLRFKTGHITRLYN